MSTITKAPSYCEAIALLVEDAIEWGGNDASTRRMLAKLYGVTEARVAADVLEGVTRAMAKASDDGNVATPRPTSRD